MQNHGLEETINKLRLNRFATGILAAALLCTAIIAAAYGLIELASAAKEILVSVITAAASLLAAVFTYTFQRAKDLELASLQRQRELELAERKAKQENYARILERLAPYVRDPTKAADDFTTAYLHTWVSGSPEVVLLVYAFLDKRNSENLDYLLRAMRNDLKLSSYSDVIDMNLNKLSTKGLFPAPAQQQQGLQN